MNDQHQPGPSNPRGSDPHSGMIHLPAPTAWPFLMSLGVTLIFAAFVTSAWIGYLGGILAIVSAVGWFRQVLPHEAHEEVPVSEEIISFVPMLDKVARIRVDETHRAQLPLQTFSVASGIKGGIAGGIAMIFPALIYGLIAQHSIWYPVNLLGGAGVGPSAHITTAEIDAFHWSWLLTAIVIHTVTCLLVGLLYGAMLPMLPRRPIVLGGILAPLLWTGLLHSAMGVINPALDARIHWGWFVISQVTFGIVAGAVVAREGKIRTSRGLPFFARMGIEAPGLMESHPDAGPPIESHVDKEKH